ncbi:MAG: PLP-dependent aminotransferase family protein [Candidatus Methanomethylophilaceae archaeon]|nr:PLP-dependent aminotransferase family protein [Candidatus Methanomethylophilaceae archaeon]
MEGRLSSRADLILDSCIMRLITVAKRPGMISFATGLPDNSLFDTEGLRRAADEVLSGEDAKGALQYGEAEGLPSLRKRIADRCRKESGIRATWENILLTNGSQECFDLLGKMFLDPGDKIAVENPGYLGALQAYSAYGPRMIGVDLLNQGPDIRQLESALSESPKLFYSIPNHQNPSGVSYSESARREVSELISRSGTVIVEDDAYGELGYRGRAGKALSSMTDNSVMTGSFSKIISPGMRIGWMIVPDWLLPKATQFLEAFCLQAGSFTQRVMDRFLARNDMDAYLKPIRAEYLRKKNLFSDLMEDMLPERFAWNDPDGGMFIWLRTPERTDAMRLVDAALERKVVLMPGKPFHVRGGENTVRLNFATASDEDMKEGMRRLGEAASDAF